MPTPFFNDHLRLHKLNRMRQRLKEREREQQPRLDPLTDIFRMLASGVIEGMPPDEGPPNAKAH